MPDRSLTGLYPILSMPFDDQSRIDVEDLQREIEFAIEAGVDGLGIAMASEIFKLSEMERDLVLKTLVQQVNGRVKVVMHTGAQGTALAAAYSRQAQALGADAIMVTPPTLLPMPDAEVVEYFKRISDAVSIPIFVQDIGAAPVPPQLAVEIAKRAENACYIKVEVPPTPPRVAEVKRIGRNKLVIFGGAGGRELIGELQNGSVGTMPGCAFPEVFRRILDAHTSGLHAEAETLLQQHMPLLDMYKESLDVSYHLTKELLRIRGIFKNANVRHPTVRPDEAQFQNIRNIAKQIGLQTS
ncbi:MAG: dihydrodipicolinate synthase family protein [Chloroflexi bacterium]|nr:dihydrodipicolinate synthase family protein [Chloroflexota bacterium]